ncbi:hypothetical protein GQ55_2G199900 [Panicum hallii var. hallii]|uniref:Uncharacterized protein n=2 Tax=Panicum hallii TaxID=206008 RepID=A0A2T7EQL6_9POAL|nr:hypothetical protein GQ55_2G199900 [Panicum hallii var. hallii]PVH64160.1 hypothetical protein PAHAL_2G205400 [Panicum hallii]
MPPNPGPHMESVAEAEPAVAPPGAAADQPAIVPPGAAPDDPSAAPDKGVHAAPAPKQVQWNDFGATTRAAGADPFGDLQPGGAEDAFFEQYCYRGSGRPGITSRCQQCQRTRSQLLRRSR